MGVAFLRSNLVSSRLRTGALRAGQNSVYNVMDIFNLNIGKRLFFIHENFSSCPFLALVSYFKYCFKTTRFFLEAGIKQ